MKLAKREKAKSGSLVPVSRFLSPIWPSWPLNRLQSEVARLFEEPFGGWLSPTRGFFGIWGPAVEVYEDKDNVFVKAELPGLKKEEIEVYLTGEMLNIAGESKEETEIKGAGTYGSARYFGRFHRSVALPVAVDAKKLEAHYKDGILTVTCPKTKEAKRKQIEIKVE